MTIRLLPILIAVSIVPTSLRAQSSATPADVVRQFIDAYYDLDWDAAATLFHPDFAAEFKRTHLLDVRYSPPTAEELMAREPGLSQEVAEYRAARLASAYQGFHGGANGLDPALAEAMAPFEYLAAVLEATDFRDRFRANLRREHARHSSRPLEEAVAALEAALSIQPPVMGAYEEGDWAWVLYRSTLSPTPEAPSSSNLPDLIRLQRDGPQWRLSDARILTGSLVSGYFIPAKR